MVPDAIFTLTNTSGSKTYQIYGTVKRITIMKGAAYTWKASSSSYYSLTGTVNMTDGQAMLLVPLNPIPAPTATPTPSTGFYNGGDGQATYTPYTDTQRQNQAMTMIDQLLEAGPSLTQLGILAVFMGLVMMLFPDGKKRRYR
jgi:nitrate reductase gamma subunit